MTEVLVESAERDLRTSRVGARSAGGTQPNRAEYGSWMGRIDAGQRAQLRALHQLDRRWNLVILIYPGFWALAALLMVRYPVWPVWIAGYGLIGICIHSLAIFMHEGIHGALFRQKSLDRWVGFILGAPALFSCMSYKVAHLAHHRYNRTEKDPDEFKNYGRSGLVQSLLFYAWIIVGMFLYLIHIPMTALRLGKRQERVAVVVEYALLAALYGAVVAWGAWAARMDLVLHLWIVPMGVAMVFANVRGWAEHAMTQPGDPLTQTRTVTSNRLVSFLMCNLNYHLEHHLCPGIPWYNLPKMHVLMQSEYRRAGAFIYTSYLVFLWDAVRAGVHGLAPEVRPAT